MDSANIPDVLQDGGLALPPHQSRIKADGLQWAASYEIARRGGLASSERIEPPAVEGYRQALRGKNSADIKKAIEESRNGFGETYRQQQWEGEAIVSDSITTLPGLIEGCHSILGLSPEVVITQEDHKPKAIMAESEVCTPPAIPSIAECGNSTHHFNTSLKPIREDFLRFYFAEMGNPLRAMLYDSDEWMLPTNRGQLTREDGR